MKIAIIGYGVEGRVSYDYFAKDGHDLTICDQDEAIQIPFGANSKLGSKYLAGLDQFDLIIRSPGINPSEILEQNPNVASKISSAINEFFTVSPTKNIIGVTGTKGKGTTSTLIAKMLEAAGKRVFLGGNIGLSPLEFVGGLAENDWVVLELSSFQLIDLKYSPHIGVCLMIAPEHLNWHKDIADYVEAKSHLFKQQTEQDIAIYLNGNDWSKQIVEAGQAQKIPYFAPPGAFVNDQQEIAIDDQIIRRTSDIKLLGKHNWQNICAAVTAVWQVVPDKNAISQVLTSFGGLEHRLQFVRELDGVSYYDDSFGTTPETAMVAIEAFSQPKIVILGGSEKLAEFDNLARTVNENTVKAVVVIGETGDKIKAALQKANYQGQVVDGGTTMTEIVNNARRLANANDVVLLSTGCASYDLFKNYKERGEQFTAVVKALS